MADFSNARADLQDNSRPTTPSGYARPHKAHPAMRALDTRQQGTFFDDSTPVDNFNNGEPDYSGGLRDSHDLSFSDGTRDSVVDNMLLSLDQLTTAGPPTFTNSAALYSNFDDDDFFLADNHYPPPKASRLRGHTHTSSHSSDYDVHIDDTASRYSSHHSRGRRSNSSSNFQQMLSRKESLRGTAYSNSREKQAKGIFGDFGSSGHTRGLGKKGSKSSGSSSLDFGYSQVLGTHRLNFGNRSASFDHGSVNDRPRISDAKGESILDRSRPNFQAYDYDAAPEPTIPAGPRRMQETPQPSPSLPPPPTYAPPQAPRRKSSVRSSASRTLRKNKSQPEQNNLRQQAQDFVNAQNLRDLPSIPAFQDPPAPSPTVAMRKPWSNSPATPNTTPKEKPGFFKRMFGGSSKSQQPTSLTTSANSFASHNEPLSTNNRGVKADTYHAASQPRPRTTPGSSTHIVSQLKSQPKPPQTATSTQHETSLPPPSLAKKHSSFFRRRKKSVSETRPPVMNIDFRAPKADSNAALPSPGISSLRKHAADREIGIEQTPGGFSPGYRPHKGAAVRAVDNTPPSSRDEQALKKQNLLNADSPKLKLKMRRGKPNAASDPHDDSFLADSSSCNEERSGGVTPRDRTEKKGRNAMGDGTKRPATSPHSQTTQLGSAERSGKKPDHLHVKVEGGTSSVSAGSMSASASDLEDDGWIITTPTKPDHPASFGPSSSGGRRVWLHPTASEEKLSEPEAMALPLEGARLPTSQHSSAKPSPTSATVATPSTEHSYVSAEESQEPDAAMPSIVEHRLSLEAAPTDLDRERALRIFNGDEDFVTKAQAAALLGDMTLTSTRVRKAYMELFDWTGYSILQALRDLCSKLILKAETQQVDRILMSFSVRWCECNPHHGFKALDVVHTICYSVLLLNTDLHMADIESRMTKNQFVRNTLPTVRRVCTEALKLEGEETLRPQSTARRGSLPWDRSEPNSPVSPSFPYEGADEPAENKRARSRLSIKPPPRNDSDGMLTVPDPSSTGNCTILVNSPYRGGMRGWEEQVETVLKDFYNSIRAQRLPLHGSSAVQTHDPPSTNNLSVSSMLRRTPSVLSKTPSDTVSYRGRSQTDFRSVGARWNSKTRSRGRLYPASTVASSRTSLDDGSVFSPAGSSAWSKYSFGKTQTSMSMESLGSHYAHGDYQQAIGFANALSQAIIREEGNAAENNEEFTKAVPLLEDETLELAGAPWAKEGILKHKHHLESVDKKAKDRAWTECFAVIEKGQMRLFSFTMNSKSQRMKNKSRPSAGSIVGGGNWMDNAEAIGTFLLRQSIASALPPPGYSKTRPHVWALSLPTGAVHLFQVGTADIVREFVSTANYWSARLSKEPLMGGVSNIEYGWSDNVINPALINRRESNPPQPGHGHRPSVASSIRSSVDQATGTVKARLPGDKVTLAEWTPPAQSMMASNLLEVDQLKALSNYVKGVEDEHKRHQELRAPMLIAFSPRHPNAARAMANWERKSSYLLREIVKFRTYIDSLNAAQTLKDKIYKERAVNAPDDNEPTESCSGEASETARAGPAGPESDGGVEAPAQASTPNTA
jgi:hypothetical protein